MENSAEVPAGQRAGRDRKGKPQKGTFKQRGELVEMRFMLKAAGLGFGVAKPWGESERYDFALDTGKRFLRVQVKSTYVARNQRYAVNAKGSQNKAYTTEQIDFLVAYIVVEDAWYVIPIRAFAPRKVLKFYPSGIKGKSCGQYERYREAWELMKEEPDGRDLVRSWALGGPTWMRAPTLVRQRRKSR
jgi:hypothetical protein